MKGFLVFLTAILAVSALSDVEMREEWMQFKKTHNKSYSTHREHQIRYENFRNNLKAIQEHNEKYVKGEVSWYKGINQFSDWTHDEFRSMLKLQQTQRPVETNKTYFTMPKNPTAPASIDWRQRNAVREVKSQGDCNDCWAFSATGSLEGQFALRLNNPVSLSEQQLLDCSLSYGNGNCDQGGSMNNAMDYVRDNGIMSQNDYPYQGALGGCRYDGNRIVARISGQKHVERMNEWAFVEAAGTIGPLSIGINADFLFQYGGGIFDVQGCKNGDGDLNHGVLAVGYDSENGVDYWIVKNSWGPQWGENGYVRMRRGINLCGIAVDPLYPTF